VLKRRGGAKEKVFGFQREATASAIANLNTFLDLQPATFQAHHVTLSLTCSESILFLPFDGKHQCFESLVNRTSTGNTFDRHVIGAVFVHVLHLGKLHIKPSQQVTRILHDFFLFQTNIVRSVIRFCEHGKEH